MKNKSGKTFFKTSIAIIICALIFLGVTIITRIFSLNDLQSELTGTLLATIITAIVTVLLLKGQTEIEENKDLGIHLFEKKQETYFDFIETLEKITQDGKINVPGMPGYTAPKSPDDINDELMHLIYQLGKIQMTASKDTSRLVTEEVGELLATIQTQGKDRGLAYEDFAEKLFTIVSDLRGDLYNSASSIKADDDFQPVDKKSFNNTLSIAGFGNSITTTETRENILNNYIEYTISELKENYPNTSGLYICFIKGGNIINNLTPSVAVSYFFRNRDCCIQIIMPLEGSKKVAIEFTNSSKSEWFGLIQGGLQNPKWVIGKKFDQKQMKKIDFIHQDAEFLKFQSADENGRKAIVKDMLNCCDKLRELLENKE